MVIHIREHTNDDLLELQNLINHLGYAVDKDELERNIYTINKTGGKIFVAEINRQVTGCVCVILDARLAEGVFAEIVSLVVHPDVRGKGIGRALVQTAEDWASKKVAKIRVRANTKRVQAHSFYESLGYKSIKEQKLLMKRV